MRRLLLGCVIAVLAVGTADTGLAAASERLTIDLKSTVAKGDLKGMVERRAIRVLVPYSKTLYFVDLGGTQRGLSYDFMRAFEESLNKQLGRDELRVHAVFVPVSRDQLIPMLVSGQGDVVAANLTMDTIAVEVGRLRGASGDRRQ